MRNDNLGGRMKRSENVNRNYLMRRCPVIIRIDGKAFHTFTKNFQKPFDAILMQAMQETALALCKNVQGCILAYTQSDEISLLLIDYQELDSSAWFDYNIQKMASVTASMATLSFNQSFMRLVRDFKWNCVSAEDEKRLEVYEKACDKGAMFDARCFNVPKDDVTNYFLWRQNDATRNSIEMVGFANFMQAEMHQKTCSEVKDMLFTQRGINWDKFPTSCKRGTCIVKRFVPEYRRDIWTKDTEIPIFKGEGRNYIDTLVFVNNK